jgi:hypothetical protein
VYTTAAVVEHTLLVGLLGRGGGDIIIIIDVY